MTTPKRQFEIEGIYHIFNRGIEKRKIFLKNQDYTRFILGLHFYNDKNPKYTIWQNLKFNKKLTTSILTGSIATPGVAIEPVVEILGFVLMPNHYHLILKEIIPNGISLFMQKMGGYSKYFNEQNKRIGHLFQGRYQSVNIKSDKQLLIIFNYVHTNPIGLIEKEWKNFKVKNKNNAINYLETYKWSSYHDYIGHPRFPQITQRDFYHEIIGSANDCRKSIENWISFKAENTDRNLNENILLE